MAMKELIKQILEYEITLASMSEEELIQENLSIETEWLNIKNNYEIR